MLHTTASFVGSVRDGEELSERWMIVTHLSSPAQSYAHRAKPERHLRRAGECARFKFSTRSSVLAIPMWFSGRLKSRPALDIVGGFEGRRR